VIAVHRGNWWTRVASPRGLFHLSSTSAQLPGLCQDARGHGALARGDAGGLEALAGRPAFPVKPCMVWLTSIGPLERGTPLV
jgi:hypothetical protein